MPDKVTVAVDAMGGDNAPDVVLEGVTRALAADENLSVMLCGPREVCEPFAAALDRCTAVTASEVISMGEHPVQAVRRKKDSSITVGCRLVKEGRADGFFSAGSTGACLAAATLIVGRAKGIMRPALATVVPSPVRPIILLDVGANADCRPDYLVQFAQMGTVYAKLILGYDDPRAALLNIGEEETKGSKLALDAHKLMAKRLPNFAGNAEGRDVLAATYEVVVTDGFTGNVCLKTIEGASKVLFGAIKDAMMSSTVSKIGALAVKGSLRGLKEQVSPDTYGGAPLLGVKGACIVGHGSSGALAIQNGVLTTAACVRKRVSEIIEQTAAGL